MEEERLQGTASGGAGLFGWRAVVWGCGAGISGGSPDPAGLGEKVSGTEGGRAGGTPRPATGESDASDKGGGAADRERPDKAGE